MQMTLPFISTLDYLLSLDIFASSEYINRELSRVGEWLILNRFSINISKAKYMQPHPRQTDISHETLDPTLNGNKIVTELIISIFSEWS